ncbi:MAG: hypothetical protein HFI87_00390 [Bacilli bacterium]|nr:hypothetical protein [Bacilli bacterium]
MYQSLNLEEIKKFLKHTKQDIIITKLNRNIVASEFHLIGILELLKTYESLKINGLTLSTEQYFWLKNSNVDILMFSIMAALGIMWYSYQNNLNDLYEIREDLQIEHDKHFILEK